MKIMASLFRSLLLLFLIAPLSVLAQSGATRITDPITIKGPVDVTGAASKAGGTFVIDHPLDPANKLLFHSFVESPDVKNIYDGIATLDTNGEATVVLPSYFLALNKDFRYLATPLGAPMPNLHLSREVHKTFFFFGKITIAIAGGTPSGKVSWQVTGIRHDPYIVANPIDVEVEKTNDTVVKKGEYLTPEFYAH